ncbi:MAG TPA: hypothetical protein VGF87_04230 [Acidimicrobiales bacterium]
MQTTQRTTMPALLSAALVAFTIEFDNAAEERMAHSTTQGRVRRGPWLTSQVFWSNALQYVAPGERIAVPALCQRARTERINLKGLQRWGYLEVEPADGGDTFVALKRGGERAGTVWRPLAPEIEARWHARFGQSSLDTLRNALIATLANVDLALPDYLPLIFPAKLGRVERCDSAPAPLRDQLVEKDLSVLLSRVLHSFALDVEWASKRSLAMCSNTLRVLDEDGIRLRDLPRLTGVSKEANTMMTNYFVRSREAALEPDPTASRGQVLKLTPDGLASRTAIDAEVAATEQRWRAHHGVSVEELRDALEAIVGGGLTPETSRLFEGLEPPEDCWRAQAPRPSTLPHFPMVLHRGGYPDGS